MCKSLKKAKHFSVFMRILLFASVRQLITSSPKDDRVLYSKYFTTIYDL